MRVNHEKRRPGSGVLFRGSVPERGVREIANLVETTNFLFLFAFVLMHRTLKFHLDRIWSWSCTSCGSFTDSPHRSLVTIQWLLLYFIEPQLKACHNATPSMYATPELLSLFLLLQRPEASKRVSEQGNSYGTTSELYGRNGWNG